MKKYIMLGFLCGTLMSAWGQKLKEAEVPTVVKGAFAKRFPGVRKIGWSRESDTEFEAEFKNNGKEQSANFDANGNWLETESEIKKSEVPSNILTLIAKEFPGYEMEEAELADTKDEGVVYEFELEKGETNYEVSISKDAKILKKEEKKGGKEDKD